MATPSPQLERSSSTEVSVVRRLALGAATLVAVALTVFAAYVLALGDRAGLLSGTATPFDRGSVPANTTVPGLNPTFAAQSPTLVAPVATATPTPAPTQPPAPVPAATSTATVPPPPPSATFTPVPLPPTPTSTPCRRPADWVLYRVQPGDTLQLLASRTGTTVEALIVANCLLSADLFVGQQLYLPFLPVPATPTLSPSATDTPLPTNTPLPTDTATPVPSPTPAPPTPTPTDTPEVSVPTQEPPPDPSLPTPTPNS